jgi:hypothetical protein
MLKYHVFRARDKSGDVAITDDETAAKLPPRQFGWGLPIREMNIDESDLKIGETEIVKDVQKHGYHLLLGDETPPNPHGS